MKPASQKNNALAADRRIAAARVRPCRAMSVLDGRASAKGPNADGLYAERDFMNLLRSSINEYDRILDDYALEDAA